MLDELAECVSGGETPEDALSRQELAKAISDFLGTLPRVKRQMFVRRYWYGECLGDIAEKCGGTPSAVSTALGRMRSSLREYLTERGFEL